MLCCDLLSYLIVYSGHLSVLEHNNRLQCKCYLGSSCPWESRKDWLEPPVYSLESLRVRLGLLLFSWSPLVAVIASAKFIPSSVLNQFPSDGHLGCFWSLATINTAAVNKLEHLVLCILNKLLEVLLGQFSNRYGCRHRYNSMYSYC